MRFATVRQFCHSAAEESQERQERDWHDQPNERRGWMQLGLGRVRTRADCRRFGIFLRHVNEIHSASDEAASRPITRVGVATQALGGSSEFMRGMRRLL